MSVVIMPVEQQQKNQCNGRGYLETDRWVFWEFVYDKFGSSNVFSILV